MQDAMKDPRIMEAFQVMMGGGGPGGMPGMGGMGGGMPGMPGMGGGMPGMPGMGGMGGGMPGMPGMGGGMPGMPGMPGMGGGMPGAMGGMGGMPGMPGGMGGMPPGFMGRQQPPPNFRGSMDEESPAAPKKEEPVVEELDDAAKAKARGNVHFKAREYEQALTCYSEAITLKPLELIYYSNKAAALISLKKYEECLATCDEAIGKYNETERDYNKLAKLYTRKARCYELMKEFDNSIEMYDKSLLEVADDKVKNQLKKVKVSKQKYEATMYHNPELCDVHREKGNVLFKAAKYPNALSEYQEAERRNPKDAKTQANISACYLKLMEPSMGLKAA